MSHLRASLRRVFVVLLVSAFALEASHSLSPHNRNCGFRRKNVAFETSSHHITSLRPPGVFGARRRILPATASTTAATASDKARLKRTSALSDWAKSSSIKFSGVEVSSTSAGGLGLVATRDLKPGDVLVEVPTAMAVSVQSPGDYNPDVEALLSEDKNAYRDAAWWAQLSVQLNIFDKISNTNRDGVDMKPWMDSLPRAFNTPIHWPDSARDELQYGHILDAVRVQETTWKDEYDKIMSGAGPTSPLRAMSYDDFVWGCECARSRAFSGSYSGSAFNPAPYAFTLLLVAVYLGFNLGTIEQAANGAAVVFCGSILKDFVLPKLLKQRRYVICPYIDMANHVGTREKGDVAFEYFANGYSIALKDTLSKGSELFISYGARSNDQLLQYYGFVEQNNPHDVYVMPPIRDWDIEALEEACGRKFSSGRLEKLDRAGLLGRNSIEKNVGDGESAANEAGGVVITRAGGIDPAIMQALRALVSNDKEWEAAGEAIGNFAAEFSGGQDNERVARLAARRAIELELESKPSSLEDDEELIKKLVSSKSLVSSDEEKLALMFRVEKKKLLHDTIAKLR